MKNSVFCKFVAIITAVTSCFGTLTAYAADTPAALPEDRGTDVAFEDIQCYEIDQKIVDEVNQSVSGMTKKSKKVPLESSSVASRDWTVFDDEYCLSQMTENEKTYYHRLEDTSAGYMASDTLNATQRFVNYGYNQYMTEGVVYGDLGLSTDEAKTITQWFINNNAQYYFYSRQIIYSSNEMYMVCYDAMADGEARAEITNEMFGRIDTWLADINSGNKTVYQKISTANDIICDEVEYDFNDYDQSLYSPVMLKKTVCAGYTRLMAVLMNGSGIPSSMLTGNNHAWNTVRFDDGKYYGVDVTWNDSLGGRYLFGCSNENMKKYDTSSCEHTRKTDYARFEPAGENTDYDPNFVNNATFDNCTVTLSKTSYEYNGYSRKPEVIVVLGTSTLTKGTDYKVSYANNIKAGTASVVVTGMGNYSGTITKTFTITAKPISRGTLTLSQTSYVYDKTEKTPNVTVKDGSKTLKKDIDYTLTYTKNINAGTATVTAAGIGNYKSKITAKFSIQHQSLENVVATLSKETYVYNGYSRKPDVTVTNGTETLVKGTDYKVSYQNNINAGTATVTITGKGNYSGTLTKTFTIESKPVKYTKAVLSQTIYTYDGTAKTPAVTVTNGTKTLTENVDYTLSYQNNINAGTAKVIITGKGNYTGTLTKTFTINN